MISDNGAPPTSPDDIIAEAKEVFSLCMEREHDNRVEARDDLEFARLGRQWPTRVLKQRLDEQRPCLTINRMPAFIRQVVNDARQNQPSIKIHPAADGADEETADIFEGLIRNIEVTSKADQAYDTALESAVSMGWGYFKVNVKHADDDTFDQDIVIERVPNPFSIYADPYSTAADSSDWTVAFETELITRDEFKRRFKAADEVDWDELGYESLDSNWLAEKQIRLATYWKRTPIKRPIVQLSDGSVMGRDVYEENKDVFDAGGLTITNERDVDSHKVTWHLLTGAEVLDEGDWPGKFIPIIPVYGDDVNFEGKRYLRSLVRDAKDPQRNFNYWRSAATELVALAPKAPFIGKKGAFEHDIGKWETANTESHAFIEYQGDEPPQRQAFPGVPAGAIQEALNAADDMKSIMGIHDASLGAPSNETSGRAIMMRQREGDVSSFHFIDNLSRGIEHGGRILVDLIPKVYSPGRIIRVMDGEGNTSSATLGHPEEATSPTPDANAPQAPGMAPQGQQPADPNAPTPTSPQAVERIYSLTAGKYDLTVETGPSFTTRREEAAQGMIALIQADPASASILAPSLAKNLDWPDADKLAQQYEAQQQNQANPAQQAQQQAQAQIQAKQAIAQQDAQIKQQSAQTDAQIAQQRLQQEFALKQQAQQQEIQLAREKMQAEMDIQRQGMLLSAQVKATEAAHRVDQTARMPQDAA